MISFIVWTWNKLVWTKGERDKEQEIIAVMQELHVTVNI